MAGAMAAVAGAAAAAVGPATAAGRAATMAGAGRRKGSPTCLELLLDLVSSFTLHS